MVESNPTYCRETFEGREEGKLMMDWNPQINGVLLVDGPLANKMVPPSCYDADKLLVIVAMAIRTSDDKSMTVTVEEFVELYSPSGRHLTTVYGNEASEWINRLKDLCYVA